MIGTLITSQTRIKLLKKFFLNSNITAHLRGLESEFGESSNGIRIELNRLEEAGLLTSWTEGNRKIYQANPGHPLFPEIHNIILKETGLARLIDEVIECIRNLVGAYICGDFACGRDSRLINLILVGNNLETAHIDSKIIQVENKIDRKVSYKIYNSEKAEEVLGSMKPTEFVRLWNNTAVN